MTTLQEQFEKDFPNKMATVIDATYKYVYINFTNYDLDLREYVNLEKLVLSNNNLTSIDLSKQDKLTKLLLAGNPLTSLKLPPS